LKKYRSDGVILSIIWISGCVILFLISLRGLIKLNDLIKLVKSENTEHLKDIPLKLNEYMEVCASVKCNPLLSPISKKPCAMYRTEIFYSTVPGLVTRTGGMDMMTSSVIEEKIAKDTYLLQEDYVISIDLDEQKKVHMHTFEWNILKTENLKILEDYLHSSDVQHFVREKKLTPGSIIAFRESIIPFDTPIYFLGKVVVSPIKESEYVGTKYKYLDFTLKGHVDAVSEKHFVEFLNRKKWMHYYSLMVFIALLVMVVCGAS